MRILLVQPASNIMASKTESQPALQPTGDKIMESSFGTRTTIT